MQYFVLFGVLTFWVLIDGFSRRLKGMAVAWGILTFLFGPIVIPIYLAKRPLKSGEIREGGTAWNLLKNFAVLWTIVMIVVTVIYISIASKGISDVNNEWAMAGAGIGMTIALAMLGAIWFFPTVGAAILGFFMKKSTLIENGPTGPMADSDVPASILSGWAGIGGSCAIALIAILVISAKPGASSVSEKGAATSTEATSKESDSTGTDPQWSFNEKKSEMDGTREVLLSLDSLDQTQGIAGEKTPTLIVRCSKHKSEVYVNIRGPLQSKYGEYESTGVRIKFDDSAPVRQTWTESTDNEAAFSPAPNNFIRQLLSAKEFRFEFTPFEKRETTVTFKVGDFAARFQPVSDVCGISSAKASKHFAANDSSESVVQ